MLCCLSTPASFRQLNLFHQLEEIQLTKAVDFADCLLWDKCRGLDAGFALGGGP